METALINMLISAAKCLFWVGLEGVLKLLEIFCCK